MLGNQVPGGMFEFRRAHNLLVGGDYGIVESRQQVEGQEDPVRWMEWWVCAPNGVVVQLDTYGSTAKHRVIAHEDGTITVDGLIVAGDWEGTLTLGHWVSSDMDPEGLLGAL